MNPVQTFSREQVAFLKDNFVVYDPIYQECYTDFSGLETAQVILIGEIHGSSLLRKIQLQFLKYIIGDQRACLLAEGLTIGQSIKAKDLSGWSDLSEKIWVHGADIRNILTAEEHQKLQSFRVQREELNLKLKEIQSIKFEMTAKILNTHFLTKNFVKVDIEKSVFFINNEAMEAINALWESNSEEQEHCEKELDRVTDLYNEVIHGKYDTSCLGLLESNQGLLQEIVKASTEFQKIVGIWGEAHLTLDDEFTNGLRKTELSTVMLLPTKQRKDAVDESFWNSEMMPLLELKIETEDEENTLVIPEFFQSYFHPILQELLTNKSEKPIIFSVKECLQFVLKGISKFTFPANQEIVFENIPLNDFHTLQKLTDVYENNIDAEEKDVKIKDTICSILKNIFMIGGRGVDTLSFDGHIIYKVQSLELHKPILSLKSDLPFTLTLKKETTGYASYLLKQMKLLGLNEFILNPDDLIGFFDISPDTLDQIIESPGKLFDWLQSKAPLHSKVFSKGEGSVSRFTMTMNNGQIKKGLALRAKNEFTIGLL